MRSLLLLLLLAGCSRHAVRCAVVDGPNCPDWSVGGGTSLSAPLPPAPPDPCQISSAVTNKDCASTNPLGLATACDPTDADGDPYDDDCTDPSA